MKEFLPLPPDWSAHGQQIDDLIGVIHWFMLVLFVFWMGYFVVALARFRSGRRPQALYAGTKAPWSKYMEVGVILVEVVLLVGFAFPIWSEWVEGLPQEDEQAVRVRAVGEQFLWNFHYPGPDGVFGRTRPELVDTSANPLGLDRDDPASADDIVSLNHLYLPVDQKVLVYLSSKDVIHSFFLPYLRVKQDAIPGQVIPVWFEPVETGDSEVACAQLCGLGHFRMRGFVHIQSQQEFDSWVAEQVSAAAAAAGS